MNKKCVECNGTGRIGVYGNVTCYECKGKGYIKYNSEWERKFDKKFTGWNAETFPAVKRFIKRLLKQKYKTQTKNSILEAMRRIVLVKPPRGIRFHAGRLHGWNTLRDIILEKIETTK